ncbi:DolP-mannose mannosyltransferase [Halobaculum sp. MBLA0147]|uniref:DolP-mannose mannosyltransferase n=1 Tax=Halobaculum sp. MBLA0147 TaxID=3079934 RepID=UPI00352437D4
MNDSNPREGLEVTALLESARENAAVAVYFPAFLLLSYTVVLFTLYSVKWPLLVGDPATYLYGGWELATGGSPYRTIWDPKPPGIHVLTGVLTVMGSYDRITVYYLSVGVTGLSAFTTVVLTIELVRGWTESLPAAFSAGVAVVAVPAFFTFFSAGPYTKYYTALFTVGAVLAVDRRRYFLAGAATVSAPLFWHFAAPIVPAVGAVILARFVSGDLSTRELVRSSSGAAVAGALTVLPIVLQGAGVHMLNQTIVAPLIYTGAETTPSLLPLLSEYRGIEGLLLLSVVGFVLLVRSGVRSRDGPKLLIAVLFVWYSVVGTLVGQISGPDIVSFAPIAAVPIGVLIATVSTFDLSAGPVGPHHVLTAAVLLIAVPGFVDIVFQPWYTYRRSGPASEYLAGESVPGCHVRLSDMEKYWIERFGDAGEECIGELKLP